MAATAQATKNQITLKGSVATVTEFFQHALSSILYQRGIYGPESFEPKKAYGLTVMAVKDDKLTAYLQAVLQQLSSESSRGFQRGSGRHTILFSSTFPLCSLSLKQACSAGCWSMQQGDQLLSVNKSELPASNAAYLPEWLEGGALQKVVLVVTSVASKEVLERWTFDIQTDKAVVGGRWVLCLEVPTWHDVVFQRPQDWGCSACSSARDWCVWLNWALPHPPEHCHPMPEWCYKAELPAPVAPCSAPLPEKAESQITSEIQAIIRQITASVTFLPLLQDTCA